MTVPYYPEPANDVRRRERESEHQPVRAVGAAVNGVASLPDDDLTREGEYLVSSFIEGELLARELVSQPIRRTPPLCPRRSWLHDRDDLLAIARDFSESPERSDVRRFAETVDVASLTASNFRSMCDELFAPPAGITRERLVVLFFFMADVAAVALSRRLHAVHANVVHWSVEYVRGRICAWVQESGGWGRVLHRSTSLILKWCGIITLSLISAAAYVYIRRKA